MVGQRAGIFNVKRKLRIQVWDHVIQTKCFFDVKQSFNMGFATSGWVRHDERLIDNPIHIETWFHGIVSQTDDLHIQAGVFLEAAGHANAGAGIVHRIDARNANNYFFHAG